ncbi:endonuclease domain-containing protein [Kocuria sp. p3-SID1433]|uniref:endonuclease domain-containing protein n=1 Tax=Kocuria sp. p3-SID1433 TaxID=2916181 RepID=UPI0021A85924|nr:endonuclease domain-containing protein [Kocuria sp. p3-SID1433]MCT2180986.1 endonuclease domain-containing protein [Kocuria sp. p3-SID1433]
MISHVTAAQVLGLRLSKRLRGSTAIHLTQTAGRKAPRRVGVVGHRALLVPEDVVMRARMRVTGPTRTAVDLAGMTRGRGRPLLTDDDLLVLLEAFGLRGWATDIELTAPGHRPVWPDLADVENRLALQIEGPHHDGIDQRVRDIERERATVAAGWREIRLSWKDMRQGAPGTAPEAVRLVRAAREGR